MSEFRIRSVDGLHDALTMAEIRNEVRGFMTHNTDEISREQQRDWYFNTYRPAVENRQMAGFIGLEEHEPIGYGLITERDDRYWVSGGLTAAARGKGFGEQLFRFLTYYVTGVGGKDSYLDVRADNEPAINLYRKIGYEAIGHANGLIEMRYGKDKR